MPTARTLQGPLGAAASESLGLPRVIDDHAAQMFTEGETLSNILHSEKVSLDPEHTVSRDTAFADVRHSLHEKGFDEVAQLSDDELVNRINEDKLELVDAHYQRHEELMSYRDDFIRRAIQASELGWMPLTERQIHARVDNVRVMFMSKLAKPAHDDGFHNIEHSSARVVAGQSPEQTKMSVFSELTNTLTGIHLTEDGKDEDGMTAYTLAQRGLQVRDEGGVSGVTYDNSVNDAVALALFNQEPGQSGPESIWSLINDTLSDELSSYPEEKRITLAAIADNLSLSTLMEATFKSDFDRLDDSPSAKTDAMKQASREIKASRGAAAVRVLRLIDKTFQDGIELNPTTPAEIEKQQRRLDGAVELLHQSR